MGMNCGFQPPAHRLPMSSGDGELPPLRRGPRVGHRPPERAPGNEAGAGLPAVEAAAGPLHPSHSGCSLPLACTLSTPTLVVVFFFSSPERSRRGDFVLLLGVAAHSAQNPALLAADAAHLQSLRRRRHGVRRGGGLPEGEPSARVAVASAREQGPGARRLQKGTLAPTEGLRVWSCPRPRLLGTPGSSRVERTSPRLQAWVRPPEGLWTPVGMPPTPTPQPAAASSPRAPRRAFPRPRICLAGPAEQHRNIQVLQRGPSCGYSGAHGRSPASREPHAPSCRP